MLILLLGCAVVTSSDLAERVDQDGDGYWGIGGGDCDDADPSVNPGAVEVCNGIDDDCRPDNDAVERAWYPDADGDGFGGEPVVTCLADTSGWSEVGGDCDDEEALAAPGLVEVCGDGLDNDCDGRVDCLDDAVIESLADAPVRILGSSDSEGLGRGLAVLDLDGDGAVELFATVSVFGSGIPEEVWTFDPVSGTREDGELLVETEAHLLFALEGDEGAALLLGDSRTWSIYEGPVGEGQVVAVHDVDGDGVDELALYDHDSGNVTIEGVDGELFTTAVGSNYVALGDVDGDGRADLLVGYLEHADGAYQAGRVELTYDVLDPQAGATWYGEREWDRLGESVALVDLTGDGADEVVVGGEAGAVLVHIGGSAQQAPLGVMALDSADLILVDADIAGSAGDVDGDGSSELLVMAAYYTEDALLWRGPWDGVVDTAYMGHLPRVEQWRPADVNGDGFGDLVVSHSGDETGGQNAGIVSVFFGP